MALTLTAIADALMTNQSVEWEQGEHCFRYYLHVTGDGEIVDSIGKADQTFTSDVPSEWSDVEDMGAFYDEFESLGNPHFLGIVTDLADQLKEAGFQVEDDWSEGEES